MRALLFWMPKVSGKNGVINFLFEPNRGKFIPVFPSNVGLLHPEQIGTTREELARPYEAELAALCRTQMLSDRNKEYFVAYPYNRIRIPLPGIHSPCEIVVDNPYNDLLTTMFFETGIYVRVFRGRQVRKASKCHPFAGDDLGDWTRVSKLSRGDRVHCWLSYRMTRDYRVIATAYPSRSCHSPKAPLLRSTALVTPVTIHVWGLPRMATLEEGALYLVSVAQAEKPYQRVVLFHKAGSTAPALVGKVSVYQVKQLAEGVAYPATYLGPVIDSNGGASNGMHQWCVSPEQGHQL